jgi:3-isopropylmalate/(R)-2-methylmalate dehydratase small subunit
MNRFTQVVGRTALLPIPNLDTDQIIPAAFLKATAKSGLAIGLFAGWRRLADGSEDPGFALNRPEAKGAPILVAGDNFGCGSSREHAVWALDDAGFRVVIAPRFADIFKNNAGKNGLLTVELAGWAELVAKLEAEPATEIKVDLEAEEVRADGAVWRFRSDPFTRHCLLHGQDELAYLLAQESEIAAYETRQRPRVDTWATVEASR